MSKDLFRPEAIDALQTRWTGVASPIRPVSAWFLTSFLFAVAVAAILFLFIGSYTKKERVSGVVMPAAGVLRIRTPENAVVTRIAAREGQSVKAGDLLLEIHRERFSDQAAALVMADQSLVKQGEQLSLQSGQTNKAGAAAIDMLQERARRATADLVNIAEEIRLQEQQVAAAQQVLANLKPLADEKIVSDIQYQQQSNQVLELRARLEGLKRARAGLQAEIAVSRSEVASLKAKSAAEVAALERSLLALDQDRQLRRAAIAMQIRAPVDGTVTALVVAAGQRVDNSTTLATLVPAGSKMEAVLFVPSSAIGFIKAGRRVVLRYDAYPFEKFGQYYGTVAAVSAADVPAADLASQAAVQVPTDKRTMFRVLVELEQEHVNAYGAAIKLKPGQTLAADLELDRRRLIEWIFDPLYALGKRI